MKKLLILSSFMLLPITTSNAASCECGSHRDGIIKYWTNGDKCCSSPVDTSQPAFMVTYTQSEGAWAISSMDSIEPALAQSSCCMLSNVF